MTSVILNLKCSGVDLSISSQYPMRENENVSFLGSTKETCVVEEERRLRFIRNELRKRTSVSRHALAGSRS